MNHHEELHKYIDAKLKTTSTRIDTADLDGEILPAADNYSSSKHNIFKEPVVRTQPKAPTNIYSTVVNKYKLVFKNHDINIIDINNNRDEITLSIDDIVYTKSLAECKKLTLESSTIIDFIAYFLLFSYFLPDCYYPINTPIVMTYTKKNGVSVNKIELIEVVNENIAVCKYNSIPLIYNRNKFRQEYSLFISGYRHLLKYYPVILPNYYSFIYATAKSLRLHNENDIIEYYSTLIIKDIYDYYTNKTS